jgi:hypothetical protein
MHGVDVLKRSTTPIFGGRRCAALFIFKFGCAAKQFEGLEFQLFGLERLGTTLRQPQAAHRLAPKEPDTQHGTIPVPREAR